ncbi:hypothetical protein MBANPS3_010308 [Mucor bainieri]
MEMDTKISFRANYARRYYVNHRDFLTPINAEKSEESDGTTFEAIASLYEKVHKRHTKLV